jgi:hypothetical protein
MMEAGKLGQVTLAKMMILIDINQLFNHLWDPSHKIHRDMYPMPFTSFQTIWGDVD